MLTLNDGRSELWQWDTGRTLAVDADCSQVHFSNKVFGRSIDVDVIDGSAIIPDVLLQTDKDLNAWAFVGTAENGYTKISKTLKVNRRNKPADYVFTPPEQTTLAELVGRLDKIEESQDPDAIKNAVEDYLEKNPVEAPVQSINGKTGAVELTAEDVGAISNETDPTVPAWAKQPTKPTYTAAEVGALPATYTPPNQTAQQVGADPTGTAAFAVSQHNTDAAAHNDLRLALQGLSDRINAALDSDDTTLDQMSEVVAYIKSNKSLIDAITTSKVSVTDIVNDLVTNVADKPLSAAQGVALKKLIDDLQAMIPETYTLPIATETVLGGVKPVTATEAMTQPVGVDAEGRLMTNPGSGGSGIAVSGATVGQTVKIAAVDDDGVPTAWEAVDLPGEEVWEDICDITFAEDVLSARILTSDMGIHYKKIEASGQGFSSKHIVCFSNASANGEHKDTYQPVQYWVVGSIKCAMNGFTRFSLYPVADKAFESMSIGSGISAQQGANPNYAPCAWGIAGNHQAATCFVSNYSAGGIDQISIYSNDSATVIPAGARLQIRGVRA